MRSRVTILGLVAGLVLTLSTPAHAILWTLSGVTFDDGGTASGSFDYDADTNTLSSINIVTTAGGTLAGAIFTFQHPGIPAAQGI